MLVHYEIRLTLPRSYAILVTSNSEIRRPSHIALSSNSPNSTVPAANFAVALSTSHRRTNLESSVILK
uniref:Uncharacterized protein n=1 Tax=Pristionchus pacificus TaxID=54126 RepID=A0A2A6CCM9_PRIPA|eukprot:PDM75867.1 hypothetical protein PRIPAC_40246 [Pristionchus pacificus]